MQGGHSRGKQASPTVGPQGGISQLPQELQIVGSSSLEGGSPSEVELKVITEKKHSVIKAPLLNSGLPTEKSTDPSSAISKSLKRGLVSHPLHHHKS